MLDALLKLFGIRRAGPPPAIDYADPTPPIAPVEPPKDYAPPLDVPTPAPAPGKPGKKTLAAVVGVGVAAALGVAIPAEESGRKVEATVDAQTNELRIRHISGKQYLKAYLDIVQVATVCDGLTTYHGRKVKITDQFTEDQCAEMLEEELIVHAEGVMKCSPGLALSADPSTERRREGPRFAAVSLAYNVGVGGYCKSTSRRRFNELRYNEGCDALLMWNKAGGQVNKGLNNRRKRERRVCLEGLSNGIH